MKIKVVSEPVIGVPLGSLDYGTVVQQHANYYLVASPMDGTGDRALITLAGGTLKHRDQSARVVPVKATVVIGEEPGLSAVGAVWGGEASKLDPVFDKIGTMKAHSIIRHTDIQTLFYRASEAHHEWVKYIGEGDLSTEKACACDKARGELYIGICEWARRLGAVLPS